MTFKNIRFISIQVLFLLTGNWILGQDSTLTLNQSVSGVKLYEATKTITLQTGFNYIATSSTQMVAKIVPTSANSNYKFIEAIENTTLDTTYQVGSISGSAYVDPSGGANYSIPIDVPPGRAGIKPQLSLNYSSKGGDGLMGLGWALGGLSSVRRIPTNLYNEGYIDNVDFDNNDEFALDGQRLVNTGTCFRTEIESFSKITLYGSDSINPTYFKVETKDGMELFYGNSTDSKVEAQGSSTRVMEWKLNRVGDKYGNYYTISYTEINNSGEIYPNKINYTCYQIDTGFYKIDFGYEARSIPFTTYINGYQVKIVKRLNMVTIKNGTTVVGKYQMNYSDSKLIEVIKFGKNNSRYNSTKVEWGSIDSALVETPKNHVSYPGYTKEVQGDYNGDGKTDLVVVVYTGTSYLYLADNIGNLNQQSTFSMPLDFSIGNMYPGDFNGDGLEDLIVLQKSGQVYKYKFLISNGNSFTETTNSIRLTLGTDTTIYTGDFNGNGKTDIVRNIAGGTPWNRYINEFNFPTDGSVNVSFIGHAYIPWGDSLHAGKNERLFDMNGNGKTDLMVLRSNESQYYELPDTSITMSQICNLAYPTQANTNLFGDFNGDGLTDVFSFGTGNTWTVGISKETGFVQQTMNTFNGFITTVNGNRFYSNDMDGNGKTDIVAIGHGTNINNPNKIYIAYSDGQNFNLKTYTPDSASINITNDCFNFGDFNGDGVMDIYYTYGNNTWLLNTYRGRFQYFVSAIENGFGYHTKFYYGSMAKGANYTKGTNSSYPVISYQGPIYNVSSLAVQGPNNNYSTSNYIYNGAHVHLKGKGFLGFEKVTSTNITTKLQSVDEYGYNSTYFNSFPVKTKINVLTDSLNILPISEVSYTNAVMTLGGKRIFPYEDSISQINYLTGVTITKDFTYDSTGNLTYHWERFDDGSYNSTTYSNFSSSGSPFPSKPQTISATKKHFHDNQTYSLTTYLTYLSTGKVNTQAIGPVTTTYGYSPYYGHPVSVRVSDGTTSRCDSFVYDNKNMFVWKSINAKGHVTLRTYDYDFGNVSTETTPITNLVRENKYDNFGVLDSTLVNSLGQIQTVKYGWTTGSRPSCSIFYKQVVISGAPTTKEYYDAFGRVLKTQKVGFDGNYVNNSYVYDNKGKLLETSLPWKQGDTPLKVVYLYDVYGRKIQESSDAGNVNYSYTGKAIQISTSGGQTSSKTMDSQGNVLTSTDNGGTVTNTYKSLGKPSSISNNGSTWSMVYDTYGRQTSLSDPNSGTIAYRYNKFGKLTRQLDSKGNIDSLTYDLLGRVLTQVRIKGAALEGTKTYKYDPSGKPGLLDSVSYSGGSEKYNYDSNGRLTSDVIRIDGIGFSTSYGYDSYSRIQTLTYPSTFAIKYVYNTFGYLDEVRRNDNNALIWDATSMNVFGQYTQYNSGNTLTTIKTYDCLGMLRGIVTDTIQNLGYSFEAATGNLISRTNNRRNLIEIFNYDNLGRLTAVSGPSSLSTSFANNGNITNKTSVGDYSYGTMPHAVTGVTNPDGLISTSDQRLTYTSFNKTDSIIQSNYIYTLKYGHQDQRTISKLSRNDTIQKTVYYAGNFEKEVIAGISYPKNIHYIYAGDGLAAIYTTQSSNSDMYYVHKDHLGSIDKITNSAKLVIQKNSFDVWGRRRNPDNWTYSNIPATTFSRGYTGHEHLDLFDLINMNGRMYDPILGRFLSPDNFVQNASGSQSYNRYSYGLNNPLKYTDPSGWLLADPNLYWNLGKEYTNQTDFSVGNYYGGSRRSGGFNGAYGLPGQGRNGTGLNGVYYDWKSETYRSTRGVNDEVGWGITSSIVYTGIQLQWWVDKGNNATGNGDQYLTASLEGGGFATGQGGSLEMGWKIAHTAYKYEGSYKWAYVTANGNFPANVHKCNQFVYDVLTEAGTSPGLPNGNTLRRIFLGESGTYPPSAGQWADPSYDIPGWQVVTNPMRGDVAAEAINYSDATGHVAIVGYGFTIGTVNGMQIGITDWGFRPGQNMVFRRFVGPGY